jgi:hypothetical protein
MPILSPIESEPGELGRWQSFKTVNDRYPCGKSSCHSILLEIQRLVFRTAAISEPLLSFPSTVGVETETARV